MVTFNPHRWQEQDLGTCLRVQWGGERGNGRRCRVPGNPPASPGWYSHTSLEGAVTAAQTTLCCVFPNLLPTARSRPQLELLPGTPISLCPAPPLWGRRPGACTGQVGTVALTLPHETGSRLGLQEAAAGPRKALGVQPVRCLCVGALDRPPPPFFTPSLSLTPGRTP